MNSAQVVKTSVTNNSSFQNLGHMITNQVLLKEIARDGNIEMAEAPGIEEKVNTTV